MSILVIQTMTGTESARATACPWGLGQRLWNRKFECETYEMLFRHA